MGTHKICRDDQGPLGPNSRLETKFVDPGLGLLKGKDAPRPIHVKEFWHDGRGPELHRMIWNSTGASIRAIEYRNPDWTDAASDLRHVVFEGAQSVQITPEEVIGAAQTGSWYSEHRPAAMFDLGKSTWLESFAQTHLVNCRHIQLLFYDELVDVICQGVRCGIGPTDA